MATIAADVLDVLRRATTDGAALTLTGTLDPKLYKRVDVVLEAAGGQWNRSARAHLFPGDAGTVLADLVGTGTVSTAQDVGWFPTPAEVVARLVDLAELAPGMEVLEPSAGKCAIASRVAAAGCVLDCVEVHLGAPPRSFCTVHGKEPPCPDEGQPPIPDSMHVFAHPTQVAAVETARRLIAGARPIVVHQGHEAEAEQHVIVNDQGECWCHPTTIPPG